MNTLFWLTLLINASGGLYGIVTGAEHAFNRRRSFGDVLVRLSLGGACFVLLSGTYKLHLLGFQQTALWITLTLWLMMLVAVSAFVLIELGERQSETRFPALPRLVEKSQVTLETMPACA